MALLDELVIRVIVDASGAQRSIDATTKKTDDLAEAAANAAKSIDEQVKALELQANTLGLSRKEATLYKLAQEGATKSDLDRARAALETAEAFDDQTSSLKKVGEESVSTGNAFAGFAAKALGALTAALSVGNAISGAVERAANITALAQTSEALDVAIEDLDAFGRAAVASGGDAQGAMDTLFDVSEKVGEAFADTESQAYKSFKAIGVAVKDANGNARTSLDTFLELSKAFEGMSRSEAVFKIKELGITDNKSVEMILKGRKEVERLISVQKEQGVVTKESAERAVAFHDAMIALRGSVSNASNSFFDSIIPALTKVVEWLTKVVDWAGEHKDFIVGFFVAIASVVAGVYLPAMIAAATATIAATWPLIAMGVAIAAAAAAFALIYEDVMNFIDGNDSLIGQIFEKYPLIEQIVMSLANIFRDTFQTIMTGASQAGDFISTAFSHIVQAIKFCIEYLVEAYGSVSAFVSGSMGSFESLREGVKSIFAVIVATIRGALSSVTGAIDSIGSAIKSAAGVVGIKIGVDDPAPQKPRVMPPGSGQTASDVPMIDAAGQPYAPNAQSIQSPAATIAAMESGNRQLTAAQASPLNAVTSSAISNTTNRTSETSVNVERVEVNTQATDAPAISRDIGSSLSDQLRNLNHESATGVER